MYCLDYYTSFRYYYTYFLWVSRDLSVKDRFLLISNLSCLGHLQQCKYRQSFDLQLLDHRHGLETSSLILKDTRCYTYDYSQLFRLNLTFHYLDQQGFLSDGHRPLLSWFLLKPGAYEEEHATSLYFCHGVFIDRFIFKLNLLWMRLPWECHNQSQDTNWRHCVTRPELAFFHKRKGVLKIDQSIKMPWHRLGMGVAGSSSSAPAKT